MILKNSRHELFAQFVASGISGAEAYGFAGFSPGKGGDKSRGAAQSASRLLRSPAIQARVQELTAQAQKSRSTKACLDREFVIEGLKRNLERAMQAEAVRDAEGNPTGEYRYNGAVANRTLELLGREIGMFIERKMDVSASPENWTMARWEQWLQEQEARTGVPVSVVQAEIEAAKKLN